jgi:hypothetical protein
MKKPSNEAIDQKGLKTPDFQYLKVKNSVQRQVKSLNVYLTEQISYLFSFENK